jgi:hypothetical protein
MQNYEQMIPTTLLFFQEDTWQYLMTLWIVTIEEMLLAFNVLEVLDAAKQSTTDRIACHNK